MEITRRGFLASLAGAVAAVAAGGSVHLLETDAPKLLARHVSAFDISTDLYVHRIDVAIAEGGRYVAQYGVDFVCGQKPTDDELKPALMILADAVEHKHGARFDIEVLHVADWAQFPMPKIGSLANG